MGKTQTRRAVCCGTSKLSRPSRKSFTLDRTGSRRDTEPTHALQRAQRRPLAPLECTLRFPPQLFPLARRHVHPWIRQWSDSARLPTALATVFVVFDLVVYGLATSDSFAFSLDSFLRFIASRPEELDDVLG